MNATEAFVGDPQGWARLRLELHDVHGLWGGRTCFVWGTGRVVAQIAPLPQHEDRYATTVPPEVIVRLVMTLIEADFVSLRFPQRPRQPDEACPGVLVVNPAGERRQVRKWASDPHAGFEAVYQALCKLADQARLGECLYQGPFEAAFVPAVA